MSGRILVVNGPNLNLLGTREPEIYGRLTLAQLEVAVAEHAHALGFETRFVQSNHEGVLIDALHDARTWAHAIVINPGAFTHYSYAIRDAIAAVALPAVEVHLSDVEAREPFRRISVISDVCIARCFGKGLGSYIEALELLRRNAPA